VLFCSSNADKISYHFIHANPCILFENNVTLGLFIKIIIHYVLYSIVQHKCSSFNLNINSEKYSINDLIQFLTPYIITLRQHCTNCYLFSSSITVAEIAYLLVLNSQHVYTLAIDLNVYSKNQQFRLFDCVKKGKINALHQSSDFPFYENDQNHYFQILQKSIVTNVHQLNLPIVFLENDQFVCKLNNSDILSIPIDQNFLNLHDINLHFKTSFALNKNIGTTTATNTSNEAIRISYFNVDPSDYQIQQYEKFVQKLIRMDEAHEGFIYSCNRGNRNTDILFFNIGGKYRFCPCKGTHHRHNTTAILVDIKNHTYCIRCKDPDCDNKHLIWNKIQ